MTDIKSINNSNVMFPDMNHYDMSKPSEMALYFAHSDFYPFKSVIENNKLATDLLSTAYNEMANEARTKDDYLTESWAMTSVLLQKCRVELLTQYSLLLTMVSLFEEAVNTLCRIYKNNLSLEKELKDIRGSGLERAADYLKDEVKVSGFKSDTQWEYITTIRDCRNMVVHNGGRLPENIRSKCDKFGIGYRKEDYQLYIEYEDINKFYDAFLDFMNRAFKIEPDIFSSHS